MSEIDPSGISISDLANSLGDDDSEFDEELEAQEPEDKDNEEESADEPDEGESEDEDAESESGEKFVIDGEEFAVPKELAPVAEKLKRYEESVRADYTRKTQEAAEMRKQAETLSQRVQQEAVFQQQNTELLVEWKSIDAQLKEYEGIDWAALAEQDIGAYSRHKEIRDGLRIKQQQVGNEFNNRQQYYGQQAEAERQQMRENTVAIVRKAIPHYDQSTDQKAVQTAIKLGEKYGIQVDAQTLSQNLDPLVWIGLVELSKYHDLVAKRPEAKKRVEAAPPAKLSRPAPKTRHQEAEKRLKAGRGRIEDLAKFL